MSGQQAPRQGSGGALVAVLLMGLAVGAAVLLGADLAVSALVVRGWMESDTLERAALAVLFLAALGDGCFLAAKLRTRPLVWGLCAGAEIAAVTLLPGLCWGSFDEPWATAQRLLAALLGGALAGVLTAMRKK